MTYQSKNELFTLKPRDPIKGEGKVSTGSRGLQQLPTAGNSEKKPGLQRFEYSQQNVLRERIPVLPSPNNTSEDPLAVVSNGKCLPVLNSCEEKEMLKDTNKNKIVQVDFLH